MSHVKITLDAELNLVVDALKYQSEINAANVLRCGVEHLYLEIKTEEERVGAESNCELEKVCIWKSASEADFAHCVLACKVHWFGVTLINFARHVGLIHGLEEKRFERMNHTDKQWREAVKTHIDDYINGIAELAAVLQWRNKVFAHVAMTHPWKDDNPATLETSLMLPIGFQNGRIRAGVMSARKVISGNSHESQLNPWSPTEVYESLQERYWGSPNRAIKEVGGVSSLIVLAKRIR